jgi:stage IV sporulation protein FB
MVEGALLSLPVVSRHGIFFWFLRNLVKVRYTFFLTAVLLALRTRSVEGVAVWIVVVFIAVLFHEYGHALAARHYGQTPTIELHPMGGVTKSAWGPETRWTDRIVISLAGPGAGFVAAGLVLAAQRVWPGRRPYLVAVAEYQFLWATLAWGVCNLLPLLPMDGGNVLADVLEHYRGAEEGRLLARKISIVTGVAGFALSIVTNETWAGLLCGAFAYDNYLRMRGLSGVHFPT